MKIDELGKMLILLNEVQEVLQSIRDRKICAEKDEEAKKVSVICVNISSIASDLISHIQEH
jgi:hypothetical protein